MFGQNANPLDIFRHSNKTFYLILVDNLVVFSSFYVFSLVALAVSPCRFCFASTTCKVQRVQQAQPDWRFLPGEASGFCRCCKMLKALQRLQRLQRLCHHCFVPSFCAIVLSPPGHDLRFVTWYIAWVAAAALCFHWIYGGSHGLCKERNGSMGRASNGCGAHGRQVDTFSSETSEIPQRQVLNILGTAQMPWNVQS